MSERERESEGISVFVSGFLGEGTSEFPQKSVDRVVIPNLLICALHLTKLQFYRSSQHQ